MTNKKKLRHLMVGDEYFTLESFTSNRQMGAEKRIPNRDPQNHADYLKKMLEKAWEDSASELYAIKHKRDGVYIEFKGEPGYDLATKSLEDLRTKKTRLCNIRTIKEVTIDKHTGEQVESPVTYATVFISNEQRKAFFKKIDEYAKEKLKSGKPKNKNLLNGIAELRKALLIESFWLDDYRLIPKDEPEWVEVWLSSHEQRVIDRFEALLPQLSINSKKGILRFPERSVKIIFANRTQLENLSRHSDDIAEYRRAKDTADFFAELKPDEQAEWVENLLERLHVVKNSPVSICILDTGVNNGHKLLAPVLEDTNCQTVFENWGSHDHDGHGTLMAGTATYGNLLEILKGTGTHEQKHLLESVKILPKNEKERKSPELWGDITQQAISRAEIAGVNRKRIICMAVTSEDNRDRGRPTSWSSALDQVISGEGDSTRRLLIVSAGNAEITNAENYPDNQMTDSVHDPGQSWNALTVGAFTRLNTITNSTFSNYRPVAPKDGLSPFSTTSLVWDDKWPIKPEIVMEGGNLGVDESGFRTECPDFSLLSTHYKTSENQFECFNMTSASAAQAAWFAAQIQVNYPGYWPETVRALMIHSAEWSETLQEQFLKKNSNKTDKKKLLRICGYGIPDLERALHSASNSLTLISQAEIQPYERKNSINHTKDMHLYELPWPKVDLIALPPETKVRMRITLSYFVEPGPGEIGWQDRYRYASFALRFDVNSPGETKEEFSKRINAAARNEDEGHPGTSSPSDHWFFGAQARDKGSIHSDIWEGSAQDLATSNLIAVSPRIGWWRERSYLGKCEKKTRYSLIVTISTPDQEIDIYTPVAQMIASQIAIHT